MLTRILRHAIFMVAALFAAAFAVKSLIIICPPNRVAVVSGRTRALSDGRSVGYRVIKGGRTLRIPLVEKVDYMDLNTIPIEVSVTNLVETYHERLAASESASRLATR